MRHRCFGAEVIYCWLNLLTHRCSGAEVILFFVWGGEQNVVLNVWQIVLANISIEGRVVDSDVYCFFHGPGNILSLSAYNLEVVHCCHVTSGVLMIKY